jgi:hypothetical protein
MPRGNEEEFDRHLGAAVEELRRVAEALVASPASRWWWDGVLRDDQRCTAPAIDNSPGPPRGDEVTEQVEDAGKRLRASGSQPASTLQPSATGAAAPLTRGSSRP